MDFQINKQIGVPLYIQIKDEIIRQIRQKELKPGEKMPTERALANMLATSRNTVSTAYRQLETEGILESHQGRGTFVVGDDKVSREAHLRESLYEVIDKGLDDAFRAGVTTDEFLDIVINRVREREEEKKKIEAVFIECNIEQARVFAQEISNYSHFTVTPLVLSSLRQGDAEAMQKVAKAKHIITTFSHVSEVKELTAELGRNIYGVSVRPCLGGIVRIARYPKDTRFALVSRSQEFHQKFSRNLKSAGIDNINLICTSSQEEKELKRIARDTSVIITSPGRYQEMTELLGAEKEVIVFSTELELGSLKVVVENISTEEAYKKETGGKENGSTRSSNTGGN